MHKDMKLLVGTFISAVGGVLIGTFGSWQATFFIPLIVIGTGIAFMRD